MRRVSLGQPTGPNDMQWVIAALKEIENASHDDSGVEEGFQPLDADLTALAALTTAAFGRSLLEAATLAALETTLGGRILRPGDMFPSFDASAPSGTIFMTGQTITDGATDNPIVAARYSWMVSGNDLKIPNLSGRFLRIWDNGAGIDPDAASRTARAGDGQAGDYPGTYQADELKAHLHNQKIAFSATGGAMYYVGYSSSVGSAQNLSGIQTENTGGNETRGKNIAISMCMVMG